MKTNARVQIIENKVTLIIPNIAARAFQLNDGDILELDLQKEYIIISKKNDQMKYIDTRDFVPPDKS